MMELSTVPAGVAAQAHTYLAQGGPENLAQLHAFLSDTVLLTGEGFAPPVELPSWGVLERDGKATSGPTVAVLYYRAQQLAGNTAYVEALCAAIEDAGGRALPVFCASLRQAEPALLRDAARRGRDGRHRARRGRHEAGRRVGGRRRRGVGRRASSPRWTSRSCRGSASPAAARPGRTATTACRRSTSPRRSPCPSSTAG